MTRYRTPRDLSSLSTGRDLPVPVRVAPRPLPPRPFVPRRHDPWGLSNDGTGPSVPTPPSPPTWTRGVDLPFYTRGLEVDRGGCYDGDAGGDPFGDRKGVGSRPPTGLRSSIPTPVFWVRGVEGTAGGRAGMGVGAASDSPGSLLTPSSRGRRDLS